MGLESGLLSVEEEESMKDTGSLVTVMDLGVGNEGILGPEQLTDLKKSEIYKELSGYEKYATKRWVCVDGRLFNGETKSESDSADPQIAGSLVISETAAKTMESEQGAVISEIVNEVANQAKNDGIAITVHGDQNAGKEGCAANAKLKEALKFNAENADVIMPIAWSLCKILKLDGLINEDDISRSIVNGVNYANNDSHWDVDTKGRIDICLEQGAEYLECVGNHKERVTRVSISEGAFDKASWISDHVDDNGHEIQAFSASFGEYAKVTFERAERHGQPDREAALKIMRVFLFNIGLCKMLQSPEHKVVLVSRSEM